MEEENKAMKVYGDEGRGLVIMRKHFGKWVVK
jgi:hypothetical protein